MLALLTAIALQTTPPPPPPPSHHLVLHTGGHLTITLHDPHLRSWSLARGGVVSLSNIHSVKKSTSIRLDAMSAGSTSIFFGCDGGHQEVWLIDVT